MSNSSESKIIVEHALANKENLETMVKVNLAYDEARRLIRDAFYKDLKKCLEERLEKEPDWSKREFIFDEDDFGFAKKAWDKKYIVGMQLYKETIILGVYRKRKNWDPIEDLEKAIKDKMRRGKAIDWWEWQFEPFGPEALLVEMKYNRDAIKEQVCKELVKISKISKAMELIDKYVINHPTKS